MMSKSTRAHEHAAAPLSPARKAEEHDMCFIVKDHTGLNLAYVYFEHGPNCQAASKLLSRGEACRIAAKIAKVSSG
jgi:hypothetical protein